MPAQVQFCVVETDDGSRIGKLSLPNRKLADWINFLVSPRQRVQIVFAEERRGGLTLYFQAEERLYSYLLNRLDTPTKQSFSSQVAVHEPLQAAIAN
ncbi:hypothetical protein J5X98_11135 [Leptothermofonsia sichuanensis E412]|jgi:hypothetical protein|uniref:hypothetical protein n=1 Tax=Leptothermofonsia sichuanensis TaxID=2917832 RepID=UPI001CA6B55E|nr:hypothetical protein [Leptothermofonsia sichuanensis]QZZ22842.1 hypothetical protein J5X98_11135 [Leptothermofonsia sichuanensis E412]